MKKLILVVMTIMLLLCSVPAMGQMLFLYGDNSERITAQFPRPPDQITKDQVGFVYYFYRFSDVTVVFQFINDKLVGIALTVPGSVENKSKSLEQKRQRQW